VSRCQTATLQLHRVHTQSSCDVILHVIATDEMCQFFRFKYQMTPYYCSDEDKIFTIFKFTVKSKQQKLKKAQSYNFRCQNVFLDHYISVTYISFVTAYTCQFELDNEECRLRIIQDKIISFSYCRICHKSLGKNALELTSPLLQPTRTAPLQHRKLIKWGHNVDLPKKWLLK